MTAVVRPERKTMPLASLLPLIIVALMAFFALRIVLSAIRSSIKFTFWAAVAVAGLGVAFLWLQQQNGEANSGRLPTLSIPAPPTGPPTR